MATKNIYVHLDGNAQELQNWSMEKMTTAAIAALAGADLFEGRFLYDTDKNKVVHYDGTVWRTMVNSSDLNKFGAHIGSYDPSGGVTPDGTTAGQVGSGVDELNIPLTTAASIQMGDTWVMNAAGTIPGIQGDDVLSVGDLLMATADNANSVTAVAQNEDVNLTSISTGTIEITVDGTVYSQAFNTNLGTTANDFVTAHAATILTQHGITVTFGLAFNFVGAAGQTFVASGAAGGGGDAVFGANTVNTAAVELAWLGIQMNINDNNLGTGTIKAATLTAPLVAATPLSFTAALATASIITVRSVQVIEDATGEDITSGLRIDWTAQEIESSAAIASVTLTAIGE